MKHIRRAFLLLAGQAAMLLALAMGASPAQAGPARFSYLVDDDGAQCNTPYRTIQSAVDAAMTEAGNRLKTITVCAGSYPQRVIIFQATNLNLVGRRGAVVYADTTATGRSGILVGESTNVNISGLTIDGQSLLPPDEFSFGIEYYGSSGIIQKNTIRSWRSPDLFAAGHPSSYSIGIVNTTEAVTIRKNSISDFQVAGIMAEGDAITIRQNTISGTSNTGLYMQRGILVFGSGTVITGNRLTSDSLPGSMTPPTSLPSSAAIELNGASNTQVENNTILQWKYGVHVYGVCDGVNTGNSYHNTIADNQIRETVYGVWIDAAAISACGDAHVDGTTITHNTIRNATVIPGTIGVYIRPSDADLNHAPSAYAFSVVIERNTFRNMYGWLVPYGFEGVITWSHSGNSIRP